MSTLALLALTILTSLLIIGCLVLFFRVNFATMATSNATSNDANERYDLFISYEWGSKTEVAQFHKKLEEKDKSLRVWRDPLLKSNNESLFLQLGQQIRRSCVFLFMLTRAYTKSDMCKRELVYAAKLGKAIFCFMLEKLAQEEIGDEIGFIMGNCVYKQYYKDPKSKEPKKDVRPYSGYLTMHFV
jgi:hypothetical protein